MDYMMIMLLLINAAIYNKELGMLGEIWQEVDWKYVKNEAYQHNCLAIIFPAVKRLQERYQCIDEELYRQWEEEVIVLGAAQCIKNYEVNDVLDILDDNEIDVAIFKGPVIANLYPEHLLRVSGDVDLLVEKENEQKTIKILKENGYEVNEEASKKNVTVLTKGNILVIELHASLWEDYTGAHIDKLSKMGIDDKSKFIHFDGCDVYGKTLNPTNHFQYIFYHIVKHFIPGGIGIRHLIDLTLFYNKYENAIDMDLFRKNMDSLGYTTFYKTIFSICIAHLGMKNTCITDNFILEPEVYKKMLEDILDAGVFGNKTLDRIKSRNVVKDAYYSHGTAGKTNGKILRQTLFPSADALSDRYVNAKKYKILLPVAWTQRALHHIKCKVTNVNEPDVIKKTKLVEERMELLRTLGL